jgi:DNA uptake protein and related DNA-binding proteins
MKKKIISLAIVVTLSTGLNAQPAIDTTQQSQLLIENLLEELAEKENLNEEALEAISDNMLNLFDNPVNINDTLPENLNQLPLSELQVNSIIDYIRKHGALASPYELPLIPGFDQDLIEKLLPFITVDPVTKSAARNSRNRILLRYSRVLEQQYGYNSPSEGGPTNGYLGSPDRLLVKGKMELPHRTTLGFTAEKDPGEQFFNGDNPNGFDFYSGYIATTQLGKIKQLVIGDYSANFGQGLVLWTGYSMGKSSLVVDPRRRSKEISPYSSTDENRYFRGIATTAIFGNTTITGFASHKKLDGNLESDTTGFTSYLSTGSHATENEMANKHTIEENAGGIRMTYNKRWLKIGVSGFAANTNKMFLASSAPQDLLEPDPTKILRAGIDFLAITHKAKFFGEFASDQHRSVAMVGGGEWQTATALKTYIVGRNYNKRYLSRMTAGFGEGSQTSAEQGICIGMASTPLPNWRLHCYVDFFNFTWLRYRTAAPSSGTEVSAEAIYRSDSGLTFQFLFTREKKPYNIDVDQNIQLELNTRTRTRLQITFSPSNTLSFKTRLEKIWYNKEQSPNEKGIVLFQDATWTNASKRISISARAAYFNTDGWDSRLYAYEKDVLYSFSVPAYYLSGARFYILTTYRLSQSITCWIRWSEIRFAEKNDIGSGLAAINGNAKNEIKAQLILRF